MPGFFNNDPKSSTRIVGWACLILIILYTIMVCAVITQDIQAESQETKYINERRARTGLKWMTIPVLIVLSLVEFGVIASL